MQKEVDKLSRHGKHSLRAYMKHVLCKQLIKGKILTKRSKGHTYQNQHGNKRYDAIWSYNSLKTLKSSANRVATILMENNINQVKDIDQEAIKMLILKEKEQNLGIGTIGSDLTFINHLMIGSNRWNERDRLDKAKINNWFGYNILEKRSTCITNLRYKTLSSDEWIKANYGKYQKYQDEIEFIRATGLRRAELQRFDIIDNQGNIGVITTGKNGKTRYADVDYQKVNVVLNLFGLNKNDLYKVSTIKQLEHLENDFKTQKQNDYYSVHLPSHVPTHIHRAYYAQQMIQELDKNDYTGAKPYQYRKSYPEHDPNEKHTIGAYMASYGAFMKLSNFMGHNRLDVLNHYLGTGR